MSISHFFRERATAYADNVVATLLIVGASAVGGWLMSHFGPVLGLDPRVALVLAWIIALIVAVAFSLLLKPKQPKTNGNEDRDAVIISPTVSPVISPTISPVFEAPQYEAPKYEAPKYEAPKIDIRIDNSSSSNQSQSQTQHQHQRADADEPINVEFICSAWGFARAGIYGDGQLATQENDQTRPCEVVYLEFLRKPDNAANKPLAVYGKAELRAADKPPIKIKETRWWDDEYRERKHAKFSVLDERSIAICVIGDKVLSYSGRYLETGQPGLLEFFTDFKELDADQYQVWLYLVGMMSGEMVLNRTFVFDLVLRPERSITPRPD